MFCPECDTRHPTTANFCMNCGIPLRESAVRRPKVDTEEIPPPRWEYQDLEIPLNFDSRGISDDEVIERYQRIVREQLAASSMAGWQPDESSDFHTLWAEGRIKWRAVGTLEPICAFDSVTIRVKRPQY